MSGTINIDISLSDLLSFIAIVSSWYAIKTTNKVSKAIANKTLLKDFFEKIFLDFMTTELPDNLLSKLELQNKKVSISASEAETLILRILKKIKPYEYINQEFYQKFYSAMAELEESIFNLIQFQNNHKLTDELYEDIMYDIDKIIEEIYSIMKEEYTC